MDTDFFDYYGRGLEHQRLQESGAGRLEQLRTQALLTRYLPAPPATIYDVGGGAGVHAAWLARQGYRVHLVDAVPLHVEQARQVSTAQPQHPLVSAEVGDARRLSFADRSADAVLLLGPLYHLVEQADRALALREAARVLRPGGVVVAATISRFASALDGLFGGKLNDPEFVPIVQRDLVDGQHRNPTGTHDYFTTAYFHHPSELKLEMEAAGLAHEATVAVEGPAAWLGSASLQAHLGDQARRQRLLDVIMALEAEPTLLGMSPHVLGIAWRRNDA